MDHQDAPPETEFDEIFGRITDAFYALDEQWRFTYLNSQAEELINLDDDNLEGRVLWEAFEWASDSVLRDKYEQAMTTQEAVSFEFYYPDPLDAWYEVNAYPSASGLSVYFRDITERKQNEEELQLFRTLLDESTDAIFVEDPDSGEILDTNATATRHLGYSQDELRGMTVTDIDTDLPTVEEYHAFVTELRTEGELTFDGTHRRKDGSTFPVEVNASYVEMDREYVIAISRDVTDRREYERRLEQQNERLEAFANTVSHDLRNPLNVADGRLELAREESDNEHLAAVADAHDRMAALIEDLLVLARSGEAVGELEAVAVANLVKECWRNVATAEATLEPAIDREIRADRGRLQQLFENLTRNAVEHGGESVTVIVGTLDDGFYIEDDGSGISEDGRDKVFDAGYSTDNDGTGFGLSIVQRIVDAHGWDIRVTDGSSGGARFEITGVEFVA